MHHLLSYPNLYQPHVIRIEGVSQCISQKLIFRLKYCKKKQKQKNKKAKKQSKTKKVCINLSTQYHIALALISMIYQCSLHKRKTLDEYVTVTFLEGGHQ